MLAPSLGELLRKAKVSEHNVAVCSDKDVLRFEVTINDACGMQALDTFDDFGSIKAGSITSKTTPSRELCCQIASRMEVLRVGYISIVELLDRSSRWYTDHDQKQVLLIMETPPEFDDERV